MSESDLMWKLIEAIPYAIPNARPFRRTVVNVEAKQGFRVRAGLKGQADLYLILKGGHIIEIETKAKGGVLSPEQKAWRSWCEAWDVPHLVLIERKDEAPHETIVRWLGEISSVVLTTEVFP
jgi:hypothetical protein